MAETTSEETQDAISNETLYAIVTAWPRRLNLTLCDLDMADILEYDILRVLGRIFKGDR